MIATAATFLNAVELTPTAPLFADLAFTAVPQAVPWPKAYGGDLVAQALAAASRSVAADRTPHSMHSTFLRPVEPLRPVRYEVEELRDGRSYSTREVRGYQDAGPVFLAIVSFHVGEEGTNYAPPMPTDLPNPEELPSSSEALIGHSGPAADYWSTGRSFDQRHVPGPLYTERPTERRPDQALWLRAFEPLPDDPDLHRIALAYVCDYTILEPILRQQGRAWTDPGLVTASLDHSLWFHREGRLDDWVLYVQETAAAQQGRGLARGAFYSRDGALLATVAQEGMIRDLGTAA